MSSNKILSFTSDEPVLLNSLFPERSEASFYVEFEYNVKHGGIIDIDLCAFVLESDGKMHNNDCLVFYNNYWYPNEFNNDDVCSTKFQYAIRMIGNCSKDTIWFSFNNVNKKVD